jgi:hypothetical protein
MVNEFLQPWDLSVATTERRVHKNQTRPRLPQPIIILGVNPTSRDKPYTLSSAARIEIERQADPIENKFRGIPLVSSPGAWLMLTHVMLQ